MKTSAVIALLTAFASAELLKSSCSSRCVEKIVSAGGNSDFESLCASPGLMRQLQPCLESACSGDDELFRAKVAFTQECKVAGVKISFSEPAAPHLDMVRRAGGGNNQGDHPAGMDMSGMSGMSGMDGGAATATPTVARPAGTGAAKASGARASGAKASGAYASATSKGVKPAVYTAAAAPRDIAGSMIGFAAAVAAAAAI
jgi:hypothetical protein